MWQFSRGVLVAVCLSMTAGTPGAAAAQLSERGEVALEGRYFTDPSLPDQYVQRGLALFARDELHYRQDELQVKLRGFGRYDRFDPNRSLLALEEAWVQVRARALRARVGIDIVDWSTTEAFHPADVINARNWNSDLENFEKLGEPMSELELRVFEGASVSAFLMPYYTQPRLTSPASPLHFGIPGVPFPPQVRIDRHGYRTEAQFGPQIALVFRVTLGTADLSLQLLEQMDRSQPWISNVSPATVFQTVRQVGGTYQQVVGPITLKGEVAYRSFVPLQPAVQRAFGQLPNRDHVTVAGGVEYLISHGGGAEGNALLEFQALLGPQDEFVRKTLTPFPLDALVGYRLAFNDESNRQLIAGVIVDLASLRSSRGVEAWQLVGNASYQQRLGSNWTVDAKLRWFRAPEPMPGMPALGLQALRYGSHVALSMTRHF